MAAAADADASDDNDGKEESFLRWRPRLDLTGFSSSPRQQQLSQSDFFPRGAVGHRSGGGGGSGSIRERDGLVTEMMEEGWYDLAGYR